MCIRDSHDAVHVGRQPFDGVGKGLLAVIVAVGLDVGLKMCIRDRHYITKEYTQQESMQCVGVLQLKHTF